MINADIRADINIAGNAGIVAWVDDDRVHRHGGQRPGTRTADVLPALARVNRHPNVALAGGEAADDHVSQVTVAGIYRDGLDVPAKAPAPVLPGIAIVLGHKQLGAVGDVNGAWVIDVGPLVGD